MFVKRRGFSLDSSVSFHWKLNSYVNNRFKQTFSCNQDGKYNLYIDYTKVLAFLEFFAAIKLKRVPCMFCLHISTLVNNLFEDIPYFYPLF